MKTDTRHHEIREPFRTCTYCGKRSDCLYFYEPCNRYCHRFLRRFWQK